MVRRNTMNGEHELTRHLNCHAEEGATEKRDLQAVENRKSQKE
jgi:hypothetical protein